MKHSFQINISVTAFCLSLIFTTATAQPSGGPYGPVRQSYRLPTATGKIYYVATDGDSSASGESLSKPATLEAAIAQVQTGDAIVMRGGIYRIGNLELNQGITIQPYEDERPVLKGTEVASDWKNLGNGVWVTRWAHLFPAQPADWWQRGIDGRKTPLWRFNNDMVFIDGRYLRSAGWVGAVDSNLYYIDYSDSLVYIGTNPANRLIEITAHDAAIVRATGECHGKESDHKGYAIRGITFTQYAYRALEVEGTEPEGVADESKYGKDVVGTTLDNCTISYCSRVAGYFRGDHLTIRHCKISDTRTEGIYVIASNDILLEGNIFTRNNIDSISGYFPAAVKIFNQCHHAECRDNLIIDLPNSNGVWYDVGEVDGVFVDNWVEGVGAVIKTTPTDQLWPSNNGFFFEISKGVVVAGNVFVNCDHGMMILNSSDAKIYQNTFVNSMACIGRNGRTPAGDRFGWHSSTGPAVDEREGHIFENNLLTGDADFSRPLLFVWQPASLCGQLTKPQLSEMDHDAYVRAAEKISYPLILWSPAENEKCQLGFDSLDGLRRLYPEFEANSRFYTNYDGPLFKSAQLGNYELLTSFPGAKLGTRLPDEIRVLLENSRNEQRYVGAFPPVQ
ncbi:MAG TPA: right-handed parallel beta-helix repeat-containing protein [Candidatus Acidoferrales bacterium]|nr:right-handed parallel beta-helix repeat-containing protein [Candidatus Acidoferrales bacterium]